MQRDPEENQLKMVFKLHQTIDKMLKKTSQTQLLNQQMLPNGLIQFLQSRNISIQELTTSIPRFIRLKPSIIGITLQQLSKSLGLDKQSVIKIDQQFYALPPSCKINTSQLYNSGIIYGMDFASSIPVRAMQLFEGCKVLQLCSAPGNKAMYMADSIQKISIVGVDASLNRVNVMKSLLKKYKCDSKIRVLAFDGITFDGDEKFDRVLIDAECTHQGSLKHVKKFIQHAQKDKSPNKSHKKKQKNLTKQQQRQFQINNSNPYTKIINKKNEWGEADFEERFLDPIKLKNLHDLQYGLLNNGFSLLKEKGFLVYSTCSFDESQNQKIVQQFLQRCEGEAELSPIQCYQDQQTISNINERDKGKVKCNLGWAEGSLKGTIRLRPTATRTGGMFVARILKNRCSQGGNNFIKVHHNGIQKHQNQD